MEKIIGRQEEKRILGQALNSADAELIAVYGRRRIGKTFLIRNYYEKELVFEFTGVHEASLKTQLYNFSLALEESMGSNLPLKAPSNWIDAFRMLSNYLKMKLKKQPIVILFDELPWICTPRSGFLQAFGHWWNTWASREHLVKVVICGSAASWIIKKIVNDRGGLHNRVTQRIRLLPFTLGETELYLKHRGIQLDRYQMLQLYMTTGGIPQYLKQVAKGESTAQTIDKLCFSQNGLLRNEFDNLYQSLFTHAENHEAVVRTLSKKASGMSRSEIIKACQFSTGGWTTELFDELEQSGFITEYIPFGKTQRNSIYKLSDEYTLFYLKFVEGSRATGKGAWLKLSKSAQYLSWSGFAFEAVCLKHVDQIRQALGITGIYTEASSWRHITETGEKGAEVDLLLDRADHCINLCEIKFSGEKYLIDKSYSKEIDHKVQVFKEQSQTRKTIFPTMITTYGTIRNSYYTGRIVNEVTMEDLYK